MRSSVFIFSLSAMLILFSVFCSIKPDDNKKFETLASEYIEKMLEMHPEYATWLGDHRFDYRLNDYSIEGKLQWLEVNKKFLSALDAIREENLATENRVDFQILRIQIESTIFQLKELREYEWNPLVYNIGSALYNLMVRDFAPLEERLSNLKERLMQIPAAVEEAKKNLKNPPPIHTETAILQNKGNIRMIKDDLNMFLDEAPHLKEDFAPVQVLAVEALTEYGNWLEKDLLPRSSGDFRLGEDRYRKKLGYALASEMTMEELLERAEFELAALHDEMYDVALPLFEKFFPKIKDQEKFKDKSHVIRAVLDRLAEDRPTADTIIDLAKKSLDSTTHFVQEKNLVTLPKEPVKVIVMPEFRRGLSVAYCDSPGPLEKGVETFYAISPPPADWTEDRVESLFREYNNYMLEILTIHEAMPGHYLQLAHSNRYQGKTMVRHVFRSGPFIEGWAIYAEQFMLEEGYGSPEIKLHQLKFRVRAVINAILDQKIHAGTMTEEEAVDLMINMGFQEEGEAAGKWRRACLTSAQLSTYYAGNLEVLDIVRSYMEKHGPEVNLKDMHDRMLSFGSPPPRHVKKLIGL